ncbi:OSJNBa0079C19.6 protein, related [Eimeria brunetti]|uniref:OSJNBa0079C19.6 protein, related n=1 Tax=Eimeria brunetti TaxID=51314 RepID=U6LMU5_9EIME|nr:OSJNBa0079C19.6 protein, related [Eimeria brunetti]
MCKGATEPNAIPVSPRWAEKLTHKEQGVPADEQGLTACQKLSPERRTAAHAPSGNREVAHDTDNSRDANDGVCIEDRQSVINVELSPWWRELVANEGSKMEGMLCSLGTPAVLVEVVGRSCEALLDTGASRSFINPRLVEALQLKARNLSEVCIFTVANGAQVRIERTVKSLTIWFRRECFTGDYLVGPVPYDIVLGLDWLIKQKVTRYFQSDTLRMYLDGRWCELPLVRTHMDKRTEDGHQVAPKRTPVEQPYDLLARQVAQMTEAQAAALLRHDNSQAEEVLPTPSADIAHATDDEDSPWLAAKLEFTLFNEWMQTPESKDLLQEILKALQTHRHVFPDSLPRGLPPKRPHDHHTLLAPGKLPAKPAMYRMTPDQLWFHKQEIAKLSPHGWIGPTYSPICAPTIMIEKRNGGTGERKMRMVVNYQAPNALTAAPDFPLPPVQTILEMLGGAKYFSTVDLEAGFDQIRMAKDGSWKTAFRSVLGLFEYKVMPFGLKGAAATYLANINAYLQPLQCHGVIAYLDDSLIYSVDLPTHVVLLRKVLSIFCLKHLFACQQTRVWGSGDLRALGDGPQSHQRATKTNLAL